MAKITKFEELEIWQLSRSLAKNVYELLKNFDKEYRLCDQMKASSRSIMENIAEGFDRDSRLEFINFLSISKGSCGELKSQFYYCLDCKLINEDTFKTFYEDTEKISGKIGAFIKYLNQSLIKGNKFKNRAST